ncbi:hypothetical protein NAT51_17670 [Flavobacterium amniphilum]|uniref:hypothetical protein n=1 Tax=Flavobacterium amniphilum TaxID=1834035 RepID=UPI00202A0917|nr:hypothetical protein [Flavobacterium amniphilum]MCL9807360.1 hypothetical protein [Flavobacterium amniphilum]
MKTQLLKTVLLFILINISLPGYSFSSDPETPNTKSATELKEARGQFLLERLKEIKSMKKSDMSMEERKALRKEVKAIKKELSTDHRGIYLSFGAAIIVLLLLILIL